SMICICLSTSTSRSAACTVRSTPRRLAASCAPFSISMKKGLFSVFRTSATFCVSARGEAAGAGPCDVQEAARAIVNAIPARLGLIIVPSLGLGLEHRVHEDGRDDDEADHDLLEERRRAQQVQAVAQ